MLRHVLAFPLVLLIIVPSLQAQGFDRPYDGLLEDASLRRIVDLQNARNGSTLIGWLADQDPEVRARAAFALASVQDSAAIPHLAEMLDDSDSRVRADAAFALGQTGSPSAGVLSGRLEIESESAVLHELIQAMGKVGTSRDLDALVDAALPSALERSRSLGISRFAMRSIITDGAVEHQLHLLEDEDPSVREAAGYFFWRNRASDAWRNRADDLRAAFGSLQTDDPTAGYLAVALAALGDPQDIASIRALLASADPRVRVRAVRALAAYRSFAAARTDLLSMVNDSSHHVAIAAASVIAAWDQLSDQERANITRMIQPDDIVGSTVSGHLLTALARGGAENEVLDAIDAARELPPSQRANLLGALAHISDARARHTLIGFAGSNNRRESLAAANALVARWQQLSEDPADYYDAFVQALESHDVGLIYAVAPILADAAFVQRGSVNAMASTLSELEPPEDTEAMLAIVDALAMIGTNAAQVALEEAARHPHDVVRRSALRQLDEALKTPEPSIIRPINWEALSVPGPQPRLEVVTEVGRFTIELIADQAPQTVETIVSLAEGGHYDGVPFHRVVPDFVIQGGDFARGDGFGGPGFEIRSEFTRVPFERGVVGMASAGKDTEGSQFFITHSMQPHLDGNYTAFGRVVEGMEVVDRVAPDTRIISINLID